MKTICVIPARYGSTRLPGKPLLDIVGKPLIQRVYERAAVASRPERVVVATDHEKIAAAVEAFGGEAVMTLATHPTGTDRLAEVATQYPDYDIIVNVQGDEPLIDPQLIDRLAARIAERDDLAMVTAAAPLAEADYDNRNAVKVVCNCNGEAMYFSRSLIPYPRHAFAVPPQKHVGIYAYRRDFLLAFAALSPTPAERTESLEQLRALEHGYRIGVIPTERELIGVDTLEELLRVRALFEGGHHEASTNR